MIRERKEHIGRESLQLGHIWEVTGSKTNIVFYNAVF